MENLKKVDRIYRDAINIFARKLKDDEKEILLKEMKEKTSFDLDDYKRTIVFGTISGCAVGFASAILLNPKIPIETIGIVAVSGFLMVYPTLLMGGGCIGSKRIILPKNPSEGKIFHESIHFLEEKGIIKSPFRNKEIIPMTAQFLYYEMNTKQLDSFWKNLPIGLKIFSRISGHHEGYKFARKILEIRDKYGEGAAWDYLYNLTNVDSPS